MAEKMRLRILTPDRDLYDDEIEMVIFRSTEGDLGVLPGHMPLTCVMTYCVMRIKRPGQEVELHAAVMSGFAEITPQCVTIMADSAEWPEEIDVERAQAAKERALQRIENDDGIDIERARLALRRAAVRIEASGYRIKTKL